MTPRCARSSPTGFRIAGCRACAARSTASSARSSRTCVRSAGPRVPRLVATRRRASELYAKLNCAACHIVKGQGGTLGPELTDIGVHARTAVSAAGARRTRGDAPNSTLRVQGPGYSEFLPVRVVMKDGAEVRGIRSQRGSLHDSVARSEREVPLDSQEQRRSHPQGDRRQPDAQLCRPHERRGARR